MKLHEMEIPVLTLPGVGFINFTNPVLIIHPMEAGITGSLCQGLRVTFYITRLFLNSSFHITFSSTSGVSTAHFNT